MSDFWYIYPKYRNMSFSLISRAHIEILRDRVKIQEIDEEVLDDAHWLSPRNIILHPILYVTIGDKAGLFEVRQKRLRTLLKIKKNIGGFETADTDRISQVAVDTINKLDVVFLPSRFAVNVFKRSGVTIPLHVVPHGLSKEMVKAGHKIENPELLKIQKLKRSKDAKLVLFFMLHSEYRKGADIVFETMEFLQQKFRDLYLVVKKGSGENDWSRKFKRLRLIEVTSWLTEKQKRELYDVCDLLLVPSRGGGFEINAVEGIARGLPTIVPDAGCFKDYIEYAIPTPISQRPILFKDNPIHAGTGWETSVDDLVSAVTRVVNNLEAEKEKAEANVQVVRERFAWKNIGSNLYDLLERYGFCDEP